MVVSGLPEKNGNRHAREIARMALSLLDCVEHRFKISYVTLHFLFLHLVLSHKNFPKDEDYLVYCGAFSYMAWSNLTEELKF